MKLEGAEFADVPAEAQRAEAELHWTFMATIPYTRLASWPPWLTGFG